MELGFLDQMLDETLTVKNLPLKIKNILKNVVSITVLLGMPNIFTATVSVLALLCHLCGHCGFVRMEVQSPPFWSLHLQIDIF
jgi:hypothetical protein